jgi:hypothetical protein
MIISRAIVQASLLMLGFMFFAEGCVVEPREGYYDQPHHRWYHEHAWHECVERDVHCPP